MIICGTDFSSETHGAVRIAANFARRWNEPLRLVHAIDAPVFVAGERDLRTRVRNDASRRLHEDAELAKQEGAPTVDESLEEGPPDEALVSHSEPGSRNLIVLGALGRVERRSGRIGSTAERVAGTARAPVLVVRAASPLKAWLRGDRSLKVVIGDDLTGVSDAALRWAAGLRSIGPCEIVVCHIYSLLAEKSRLGIGESLRARIADLDQANLAALRRHAAPTLGDDGVRYRVEGTLGRAAEPLLQVAIEESADLVIVGTGQRSRLSRAWHGWASQLVLSDAPCSVACIPAGEMRRAQPEDISPLRHVLAATDFSPAGDRAVAYAHAIVAKGGTVHVLHVQLPGAGTSESDRKAALERLRRLTPESRDRETTRYEVVDGESAAAAITAAAEKLDVDVVCLGTHGHSGLLGALLGSVALEVAERCRRQVLLVPPRRVES